MLLFLHFPQSTRKICFDRSHWCANGLNVMFSSRFSCRHRAGQVRKADFDGSPVPCGVASFFPHLSLRADYCFALGSSHHQFNKSDQQNHFHPWLSYFWTLQSALEVWVVRTFWGFFSLFPCFFFFFAPVILDEVLMFALSHRVGQLRLVRVMRLICVL